MKILITGGNGDIAQKIVAHLNKYEVLNPDINELDISDEEQVKSYMNEYKPEILINNAAIFEEAYVKDAKRFEEVIKINLIGTYYCCKYAIINGCKKIINISSAAGFKGKARFSSYGASKAGIITLTDSLVEEGIEAYCLIPHRMNAGIRRKMFPNEDVEMLLNPEVIARVILNIFDGCYSPGERIDIKKQL